MRSRILAGAALALLVAVGCGGDAPSPGPAAAAPPSASGAEPLSDVRWPADAKRESSAMRRDGAHVVVLTLARDLASADAALAEALARAGWTWVESGAEGGVFVSGFERDGRRLEVFVEPTGATSSRAELTLAPSPP